MKRAFHTILLVRFLEIADDLLLFFDHRNLILKQSMMALHSFSVEERAFFVVTLKIFRKDYARKETRA